MSAVSSDPFRTPPFNPSAGSAGGGGGGGGFSFGLPSTGTLGTLGGLGIGLTGLIAGLRQAGFTKKQIKRLMKNSEALQALLLPLAQQFLQFGVNPAQFLRSPQGQATLRPLQEATARNFEGARVNMIDTLAGSGFSPSSGLAQGPLANLFAEEASAQSGNVASLISQSQNLGLQGANILQGQQGALVPFANAFANLPNTGFQIAGAGGQFLNTLLQLQSISKLFPGSSGSTGGG